jgi:hypothetical protein
MLEPAEISFAQSLSEPSRLRRVDSKVSDTLIIGTRILFVTHNSTTVP